MSWQARLLIGFAALCHSEPSIATHLVIICVSCWFEGARVVVCRAQLPHGLISKAAAAGVSVPALLAAHPALALVDNRLATEGTGKIFGITDSGIFWNMLVRAAARCGLGGGDHGLR